MNKRPTSARGVAAQVLLRVAKDEAFAATTLDAELSRAKLAPRDAGLATEITYGTLRSLIDIDEVLARYLTKSPASLDPEVRAILRTGAYQILYLSRIPVHSAVDESVTLASNARGKKLGGLVNAVLRKVVNDRPAEPRTSAHLAVPRWLKKELEASLGVERAQAFIGDRALPLPLSIRVETDRISRDAFAAKLSAALPNARVTLGSLSQRVLLVEGAGDPRTWPGYLEGEFAVQDEGSVVIAELLEVKPGERVLDACAGRGGKTLVLARAVGATGSVLAVDVYPEKLEKMESERARLQVDAARVETMGLDLAVGAGGLSDVFDRVLVDAPCTGLGTVHRRPEILMRLEEKDIARMQKLQLEIVERAASLVRKGGVLVYSVCSPTRAEGIEVVHRVLAKNRELALDPGPVTRRHLRVDEDGALRLGPWSAANGPDAYQVFSFVRLP